MSTDNPFGWRVPEGQIVGGELLDDGRFLDASAEEAEKQARMNVAVLKAVGVTDPEKEKQ